MATSPTFEIRATLERNTRAVFGDGSGFALRFGRSGLIIIKTSPASTVAMFAGFEFKKRLRCAYD